jgi:O-antigen/teichoic acid export membrane protein
MMAERVALIEKPVDTRGSSEASQPSRARRLFAGWSANLVQLMLGMTQQVALVPVFLHYWTADVLAAWLVIYAAGNLVLVADAGLQFRAIHRFLGFKSSADCDGRTAQFYSAMRLVYLGLVAALTFLLVAGLQWLLPSSVLGFAMVPHFDAAFAVITLGSLWTVPSNLVAGLYRARGLYGRAVKIQNVAVLFGQLAQLVAIVATGSLLAVTLAYIAAPLLGAVYLSAIDGPRLFPLLRRGQVAASPRWLRGQLRKAAPFALAGATDLVLLNLPVLLVSGFVSDRVAVAQWSLTRVVAGLLRALCTQTALPLAAELGHDYAVGARSRLQSLYARGSALVTLLASVVVSGLLPFWQDFFALWTRGAIPYDPHLTLILMIGTAALAPSILAISYANYSGRGGLLVRTKGLQLALFLVLSLLLVPSMGPFGAAIAVVASELTVQIGVLGLIIMGQTLEHPLRHAAFLVAVMITVTMAGWALGAAIRLSIPLTGPIRFFVECAIWLAVVMAVASPLAIENVRARLAAAIPR